MSKHIEDADSLQYKQQLADFMKSSNPKPTIKQLEKLREMHLERRK